MIAECRRMHSLIERAEELIGDEFKDEDPGAFWDMVHEVELLMTGLKNAAAKAEGK